MTVVKNISESWNERTITEKTGFLFGVVVVLGLIIFAISMLFNTRYGTLFSDLESHDASAIIKELDRMKVIYKLQDDGRKILVKEDDIHKIRLDVMGKGVMLSGGVGFEIFDKDEFGTTEFAQKVKYLRALQGELARTIMSNDIVRYARVHLVLPDSSLFKKDRSASSASVTVILKKGHALDAQQVKGIQQLVSSSVAGMKLNNVTVLNQKGIPLAVKSNDSFNMYMASSRLEKKREIEDYLMKKALKVLDKTFGVGVAMAMVDVSMDFNNTKRTRETVDDNEGLEAPILKKRETKSYKNRSKLDKASNSTIETEYSLGKVIEHTVSTPGTITQISIALLLPDNINDQTRELVQSLVARAVGYDESRGDKIAIHTIDATRQIQAGIAGNTPISDMAMSTDAATEAMEPKSDANLASMIASVGAWVQIYPVYTLVILLLVLILAIFGIVGLLGFSQKSLPRQQSQSQLSDSHRQAALIELKNWLGADETEKKVNS